MIRIRWYLENTLLVNKSPYKSLSPQFFFYCAIFENQSTNNFASICLTSFPGVEYACIWALKCFRVLVFCPHHTCSHWVVLTEFVFTGHSEKHQEKWVTTKSSVMVYEQIFLLDSRKRLATAKCHTNTFDKEPFFAQNNISTLYLKALSLCYHFSHMKGNHFLRTNI